MTKDYYETLGLPRSASADDVRKAFRKLASEHHPDKGGDPAKFKEINHAHQVLSDDSKRALYDRFGTEDPSKIPPPRRRDAHFNINIEDIFRTKFDPFQNAVNPFGSVHDFVNKARAHTAPGGDVNVAVSITMEDALAGVKREVRYSQGDIQPCTSCERTRHSLRPCPGCGGSGRVYDVGLKPVQRACFTCRGSGSVPLQKCGVCNDKFMEEARRTVIVSVPKGFRSGCELRYKGHGKPGNPAGDLFIKVDVLNTPAWWAHGNDLFTVLEVPFHVILNGGPTVVRIPGGSIAAIEVPKGGGMVRIPKAWKNPHGSDGDGDLTVIFKVNVPGGLSPRATRLTQELREELDPARRL